MRSAWALLFATLLLNASGVSAGTARADDAPPCGWVCVGGGDGGGFGGTGTGGTGGGGGGGDGSGSGDPISLPDIIEQTSYVPTCPGDSPDGGSGLCGAATTTCPVLGDIRYWLYVRQYNQVTQTPVSPWRRRTPPAFLCLGPNAPGVDPLLAAIGTVQRDFAQFPIERADVRTRPEGLSLVNAVTELSSSVDGTDVIHKNILGLDVVVTAVAQSYTWKFGDGAATTIAAEGGPPATLGHQYVRPGQYGPSLDVVYGGTFTVAGSPLVYDIEATATVLGPPAALGVGQARTQLEQGVQSAG